MHRKYTPVSQEDEPPAVGRIADRQVDRLVAVEPNGASPLQTAVNLANGQNGLGLLPLPFTVVLAGGAAFATVAFVAVLSWYCACVIAASLYSKSHTGRWERQRKSYHENGVEAFGSRGGVVVLAVQLVTLVAASALFLVLVGSSLATAIPGEFSHWLDTGGWTVASWLVISTTAWIPSLRQMSWLSAVGMVVLFGLFGAVLYVSFTAPLDVPSRFGASDNNTSLWTERYAQLPSFTQVQSRGTLPCVFGMILFSFSSHTMIPALEDGMRPSERSKFPFVLAATFGFSMLLRVAFMWMSWMAFGPHVAEVVTAGLRPLPLQIVATLAVAINTALTLALMLCILQMVVNAAMPLTILDSSSPATLQQRCLASVHIRRVAISLSILSLVIAVPNLPQIMAFTGSLASTTVVFVLPLACHLKIRHAEAHAGRYEWQRFYCLLLGHGIVLASGATGGAVGFATAALSKCTWA